ncbi:hypothetical protein [Halorussus marinus]|uniref:hypothetical protein n=1 Tax=Halorussus marinus TaxID=2505976 RepID=UPI00106E3C1D|nr:hypothetical protein [Halorussus marinus]
MADTELRRRLAYVHQTLELIAFLLAVAVAQTNAIGLLAGVGAVVLLAVNVATRTFGASDDEPTAE